MTEETYMGDGVYASFDGWQICLRTPREDRDDRIYLEPNVLEAFLAYLQKLGVRMP